MRLIDDNVDTLVRRISPFTDERVTGPDKPDSYNDDLRLSCSTPCAAIWAGGQRKKIQYNISDAISRTDHVGRAMKERFHLSDDAPLPPEIKTATEFLLTTPDREILCFWEAQILRLKELVGNCAPTQADWGGGDSAPNLSTATGIKAVAIHHLLTQLGLGGSNWRRQFIYGFGALMAFPTAVSSPPTDKTSKPCPRERAFEGAVG